MADYIIEPLDTNAEAIFQDFVTFVQQTYPNYQVSEGQLDVIIARFFSVQVAFTADMASRVQRAIYRYFGSSLASIPPLIGTYATANVNFVIAAPSGIDPGTTLVLSAGTLMGVVDLDGDTQLFALVNDVTILATDTSATGLMRALEIGAASNGLTGSVQMVELTDWILSSSVMGTTTGGSDPEDDDDYINRLTENLALMAPRPLLAHDFSVMARNIPGVWRSAVIENFGGGANEVQRLVSTYTGGQFRLTFTDPTATHAIAWNASAADFQAALVALDSSGSTDFLCTGGPLGTNPVLVTFTGKYGYTNVPILTVDTSALTGGGSFTITTDTTGSAFNTTTPNSIAICAIDADGLPLAPDVQEELTDYLQSYRAQNFLITFIPPAYNKVDITYSGVCLPGNSGPSIQSDATQRLTDYVSPNNFATLDAFGASREWVLTNTLRYLEMTTIVENTPGWDYTQALSFSINGGSASTTDKTLLGTFPLPIPDIITGTVTEP